MALQLVVTDLALFDFGSPGGEMRLVSLHPPVTLEAVRGLVGWDLQVAPELAVTPPPTDDELRLLREGLDPEGLYRH